MKHQHQQKLVASGGGGGGGDRHLYLQCAQLANQVPGTRGDHPDHHHQSTSSSSLLVVVVVGVVVVVVAAAGCSGGDEGHLRVAVAQDLVSLSLSSCTSYQTRAERFLR